MFSVVCRASGRVLGGILLCLGLSACGTDGFSFASRGAVVDRQTLPPPTYQADAAQAPLPARPVDFPSLARQMSGGDVVVYDLNDSSGRTVYDPPPFMDPRVSLTARPSDLPTLSSWVESVRSGTLRAPASGVPSAADSSVLLFPVEGGVFSATESGRPPARIAPGYLPSDRQNEALVTQRGEDVDPEAPGAPLRIYFDHNSARLGAKAKKALSNVAQKVKGTGGAAAVIVEGHASPRAPMTDPARRETANLKKSLDRAYAVSDTLIRQGVPVESIVTTGYGDGQALSGNRLGRDPESSSRRVDVKVAP